MLVDLRSDTITRPSPGMREAMAKAEVGDDVYGEDPTVNRLQERAAALVGKEAALYLPSGTMSNLTAIMALTSPGDSVIICDDAHPVNYESGGISGVASVMPRTNFIAYWGVSPPISRLWTGTTPGWSSLAVIFASSTKRLRRSDVSDRDAASFLTATSRSSSLSSARQTDPKPPFPQISSS